MAIIISTCDFVRTPCYPRFLLNHGIAKARKLVMQKEISNGTELLCALVLD